MGRASAEDDEEFPTRWWLRLVNTPPLRRWACCDAVVSKQAFKVTVGAVEKPGHCRGVHGRSACPPQFLSVLSDGQWIVGLAGPEVRVRQEEVVMSTPNEPGAPEQGAASTPEPGSQAAAHETSVPRETRRARVTRGARAVVRHRATAIVGAALVGLLVGGGVVAALEGASDRGHGDGYRGHHGVVDQSEHGHRWFGHDER
jgi:hypothetical protein